MFTTRFIRWARLDRLGARGPAGDRAVILAFAARLTDELLSGAWSVLSPTFRRVFRLSLVRVGMLSQVLGWVALVVEPVTASLIDLSSRRRLVAAGSTALTVSMVAMGLAPTYVWLLIAFGAFGAGSGPLVHTADVLVVEAFPAESERAYARSTFLDTTGALAGPALVAAATAVGVSWRVVLVGLGVWTGGYALLAVLTPQPRPPRLRPGRRHLAAEMVVAVHRALANPRIRRALLLLWCFDLFEAAFVLKYIWLHDALRLSEPAVALWAAVEQVVDLVALALLDRWLRSHPPMRIFRLAAGLLPPLSLTWVLVPGLAARIALGVPLAFTHALIWPLAKPESLTADPELAGATLAVTTMFPLVPLALLESGLAEAVGTGPAMAGMAAVGAAAMWAATFGQGERRSTAQPPPARR